MSYQDLRDFLTILESKGELKRITLPISPNLEITEVCHRCLLKQGPALLFENPSNFNIPLLGNLFGTVNRVAAAMGQDNVGALRDIGKLLAFFRSPPPPANFKEALQALPKYKQVLDMAPKMISKGKALCQQQVITGSDINLSKLPIQTCWPGDVAPLITWGAVITKGPGHKRQNLGIYRQQVIDSNKVIMRWLSNRGGALDYHKWQQQNPQQPFPVTVALGADPATILAAVTPIPDSLSEYAFAGLLRGQRSQLVPCLSNDLQAPANCEIILEGHINPDETATEGPYGDHTGYYNETETFPVFTINTITMRDNPIYHSTYTGKPPDEPAILGAAFNEVFIPILQQQFPEIVDFYLPPEGCSYRLAVISINKAYKGHAKRIMFGIWSFLHQFMYTKFLIVTDEDIDIRDWQQVIWAITTRSDPARDTVMVENTPIDYLDFASPVSGLGSKMGIDATNKWPGETNREWGTTIKQDPKVIDKIDEIWSSLGI